MGLGDMILCNGLVRNICKKFNKVATFVKPEYYSSIAFMYRDLLNLEVIPIPETNIDEYLLKVPVENKITIGFHNIEKLLSMYRFDECFYRQVGLNFQRRWSDFYLNRDKKREEEIMAHFKLKKNEYIFIHDDRGRGYNLQPGLLPTNIQHFRPDIAIKNIFDYCTVIENAKEVHVMDSSFKHIVDSLDMENSLFYHIYVRGASNINVSNCRQNWHQYK